MEKNFLIIGIAISVGVNFFLLYNRKKQWATDRLRWTICGLLLIVGLFFITSSKAKTDYEFMVFSCCLITPIIYNSIDRLFKKLCKQFYGRDFYLWLRYSSEIDDRLFGKNPHVKGLDILFSISLVFLIIVLPVIVLLLKQVIVKEIL